MNNERTSLGFRSFWSQQYATRQCPWMTRVLSQRAGALIAWLAWRGGCSANQVTVVGLPITLAACALYLCAESSPAALLSMLLFQLAFGFDCADGQLARATASSSDFGGWLDVSVDYARNAAIAMTLLLFLLFSDVPAYPAALAVLLYSSGELINLHTVTYVNRGDYQAHGLSGARNHLRVLLLTFKDTPVVLLCIGVLWWWPHGLLVYLAALGLLHLLVATFQARARLIPRH